MSVAYANIQDIIDIYQEKGSSTLLECKRTVRSSFSELFWFLVSCIVVYSLIWYFPDLRAPQDIPIIKYLSINLLVIIPVIVLLETVRRYHNNLTVFDLDKVTSYEGRLGIKYSVPVIKYSDIRLISVRQDIIGRILNYGNVELNTAAESGTELVIRGVIAPHKLAQLIDELRSYSASKNRYATNPK